MLEHQEFSFSDSSQFKVNPIVTQLQSMVQWLESNQDDSSANNSKIVDEVSLILQQQRLLNQVHTKLHLMNEEVEVLEQRKESLQCQIIKSCQQLRNKILQQQINM